ncbi:hypothetical protein C8034_v000516 [Colletotrichum sidae]|uniref:Uncharacterized protein n=1 Tax=Colletotrichum sidae TaxID=1347389 RepID=A0A4R8TG52_9PEZI|nr:hypothetical protein C8034_v000516 [Colletotrichum sidae]
MCRIAKVNCETCNELQTVLVRQEPTLDRPNLVSFLTDNFHLPCDKAKLTGMDCRWLCTQRFSTKVPKKLCKKCQALGPAQNYEDWFPKDRERRKLLLRYLLEENARMGEPWWKVFCF